MTPIVNDKLQKKVMFHYKKNLVRLYNIILRVMKNIRIGNS